MVQIVLFTFTLMNQIKWWYLWSLTLSKWYIKSLHYIHNYNPDVHAYNPDVHTNNPGAYTHIQGWHTYNQGVHCLFQVYSLWTYRVTAPSWARMKAALGLAERTSCWTYSRRGCFCSDVRPVNTTVLTTPETRGEQQRGLAGLLSDQIQISRRGEDGRGDSPWLHCSSSLGNAYLQGGETPSVTTAGFRLQQHIVRRVKQTCLTTV